MLKGLENKNMMLVYAVIGFGSIALVALGELASVEAGSFLYDFYLRLIFGGFLIFYTVLIHFALLPHARRLDEKGPRSLKFVFGESSSRLTVVVLMVLVLIYWIHAFAKLMNYSGFEFF